MYVDDTPSSFNAATLELLGVVLGSLLGRCL